MTPLVGRARALARLEAVLASGGEPGTSVVDITGEAGTGKSRLLSEVCRRARQLGFTSLRCCTAVRAARRTGPGCTGRRPRCCPGSAAPGCWWPAGPG
ncbi:ATP-binding protein [Streptomyces sp. NPDC002671]